MANYKTTFFSLLLSTSASIIQPRDFTQAENFVLSDCGIGTLPNPTDSTSREIMYYPGDVWNSDGSTNRPTMIVNVPWDGSYPWRNSGVRATMPNGDEFTVVVDPKHPDPEIAGLATHTYNPIAFSCYSFHKERLYQLDDGKWCSSAYVCNHRSGPGGPDNAPPAPPAPAPKPPKEGTETTFSVNADMVRIYNGNHHQILGRVDQAKKTGSRDCIETPIDIGDSCKISFVCHGAGKSSVDNMAATLLDQVANSKGFASYDTKTSQICVKPDPRPGHEGECVGYKDKVDTYVTMPKTIGISIDNIPAAGSPDNPSVQASMRYTISCSKSSWSCEACKIIGASLNVISAATLRWNGPGVAVLGLCASAC